MILQFGKHRGLLAQLVVLTDPDYVLWLFEQQARTRDFQAVQKEIHRLIQIFDSKPLTVFCREPDCDQPATRGSLYPGALQWLWWCDACVPSPSARSAVLLRSYLDVVNYVHLYCRSRKRDLGILVRRFAEAKGFPARVGETAALNFFATPVAGKHGRKLRSRA